MGDVGDLFKDWAQRSKDKRASNREVSPKILTEAGIEFTVHNGGAHLIVAGDWDLYPGTGLFKSRTLPIQGRGVRNLLRQMKG